MPCTTGHVILRWHLREQNVDVDWYSFLFLETSTWHFGFEVECQMRFVKHTHWSLVFPNPASLPVNIFWFFIIDLRYIYEFLKNDPYFSSVLNLKPVVYQTHRFIWNLWSVLLNNPSICKQLWDQHLASSGQPTWNFLSVFFFFFLYFWKTMPISARIENHHLCNLDGPSFTLKSIMGAPRFECPNYCFGKMNSQKCKLNFMLLQVNLALGYAHFIGILNLVHYIDNQLNLIFQPILLNVVNYFMIWYPCSQPCKINFTNHINWIEIWVFVYVSSHLHIHFLVQGHSSWSTFSLHILRGPKAL